MLETLIILGGGGWFPAHGRQTACALLRDGDSAIMIDAGTGVGRLVERPELLDGIERLDILLTHFHLDHVAGLAYLPGAAAVPRDDGVGTRAEPVRDPDAGLHRAPLARAVSPRAARATGRSRCATFPTGEIELAGMRDRHAAARIATPPRRSAFRFDDAARVDHRHRLRRGLGPVRRRLPAARARGLVHDRARRAIPTSTRSARQAAKVATDAGDRPAAADPSAAVRALGSEQLLVEAQAEVPARAARRGRTARMLSTLLAVSPLAALEAGRDRRDPPAALARPLDAGSARRLDRERDPDPEQRPGDRVLEEVGVQHRVEHEREERRARSPARAGSRRAPRSSTTSGDDHERHVDELADQALLGGDRDRDRVRRRQRLRAARMVARGTRARTSPTRSPRRVGRANRSKPPLTRLGPAARGAVQALVEAERLRRDRDRAPPDRDDRRRRPRAPARPSSAAPRGPPSPTSSAARLERDSVSTRPPHRIASTTRRADLLLAASRRS